MAISRDKKNTLVTELGELFADSKLAVGAAYSGLNVADMQNLRAVARENNVIIKVAKNRLIRVALSGNDKFKSADTKALTGQIVYAFSNKDEVAPAQVLASFAKSHPDLKLVVGFDNTGKILDSETINALAALPSKDQLRGQLVSVIAAPLSGFLGVANGTERALVRVLSQRVEAL